MYMYVYIYTYIYIYIYIYRGRGPSPSWSPTRRPGSAPARPTSWCTCAGWPSSSSSRTGRSGDVKTWLE